MTVADQLRKARGLVSEAAYSSALGHARAVSLEALADFPDPDAVGHHLQVAQGYAERIAELKNILSLRNVVDQKQVDALQQKVSDLEGEVKQLRNNYDLQCRAMAEYTSPKLRIRALEAEKREHLSVLALLRLHRIDPDTMDEPIPAALLNRENTALGKLEGP